MTLHGATQGTRTQAQYLHNFTILLAARDIDERRTTSHRVNLEEMMDV